MGSYTCGSKTRHPGEDFIWNILNSLKTNQFSYSEIKANLTSTLGLTNGLNNFPMSFEQSLTFSKIFYEQDKSKNPYFNYHSKIFRAILENEYSNPNSNSLNIKLNSFYILYIVFGFIKKPYKNTEDSSRKERLEQFMELSKALGEKNSFFFEDLKSALEHFLEVITVTITKAIKEEAVGNNVGLDVQKDLNDLLDNVYTQNNLYDFITSVFRDFEERYNENLGTLEIDMNHILEIFEKKIYLFYIQELRFEMVRRYSVKLIY